MEPNGRGASLPPFASEASTPTDTPSQPIETPLDSHLESDTLTFQDDDPSVSTDNLNDGPSQLDPVLDPNSEQNETGTERDPQAEIQAKALANLATALITNNAICSCVLGDIWHLMDQFKISVHHGLRRPFARALRDALLLPDEDDKAAVEQVLAQKNVTFDQMVLWQPDWVWRRVKRCAPPPEVMYSHILQVITHYGPLKDATTGQPLFNTASWDKAKNVLENVWLGYYSDPPGISLYMVKGQDQSRLSIYRCSRGTNNVKGGIHQNIICRFGSFNASPRFAVNLLRDYCLSHNLEVVLSPIIESNQANCSIYCRLEHSIGQVSSTKAHTIYGLAIRYLG